MEINKKPRNIFIRILFSSLWFLPCIFLPSLFIGMVIGGYAGSGAEEPYLAGQLASKAFFQSYGKIFYLGEVGLWLALSFFGKLPGTGK